MSAATCRFCGRALHHLMADLGTSPLANSYLTVEHLSRAESFYPLRAFVCEGCFLVQLEEFESPSEIFSDYAYFSSFSTSWLAHAEAYARTMIAQRGLDKTSTVVEVASNDGYLLQYFLERGISVLGVEPAINVAAAATAKGIPTHVGFFGRETATQLSGDIQADLVVGNNVLAHVPDLNDFVAGLKILLKVDGLVTVEFPHLLCLLEQRQFDTIYHEHFSYFSFSTAVEVFAAHGLRVVDVEELPTHGGSLRVHAVHSGAPEARTARADRLMQLEADRGLRSIDRYLHFADEVRAEKRAILRSLIGWKDDGLTIAGYGAPAKGNTLLNYCGIGTDFIDFTVDRSPHKQGHFLPGSRIPVKAVEAIREGRPDLVLILPWNLRDEIMEQLAFIGDWGGRFAARTPELVIFE